MGSDWGTVNDKSGQGSTIMGNGKRFSGQVVNSPRYSGPMTRRALSFKRNNGHDVEVAVPDSPTVEGDQYAHESRPAYHQNPAHIKPLLKKSAAIARSFNNKAGSRQCAFYFCGVFVVFLILMKISTLGWLGYQIEQNTMSEYWDVTQELNTNYTWIWAFNQNVRLDTLNKKYPPAIE